MRCVPDGQFVYWDKENKQRLKLNEKRANSLTCADWSADGSMLALGVSYDYSKGAEGEDKGKPNHIAVHRVADSEIQRNPVKK